MKNNKGFTLIELLMVIAIVSVLTLAVGLNMSETLKRTNNSQYEETKEQIAKAALIYIKLKSTIQKESFTISDLIEKGLLDENITSQNINETAAVNNQTSITVKDKDVFYNGTKIN